MSRKKTFWRKYLLWRARFIIFIINRKYCMSRNNYSDENIIVKNQSSDLNSDQKKYYNKKKTLFGGKYFYWRAWNLMFNLNRKKFMSRKKIFWGKYFSEEPVL